MTQTVATIEPTQGESVAFALQATAPEFAGTETVTCDVKPARNGSQVPPNSTAAVLEITPTFVPTAGEVAARWSFAITPAQSAALAVGGYVTDARIQFTDGSVVYADPVLIKIAARVTE